MKGHTKMENQNNKIHLNLKAVGLVAKKSEEVAPQIEKIVKILKKKNINLLVEKSSAEFFGLKGVEFKEILQIHAFYYNKETQTVSCDIVFDFSSDPLKIINELTVKLKRLQFLHLL